MPRTPRLSPPHALTSNNSMPAPLQATKGAGKAAKASKAPLGSHNASAADKSIEETYQKLSQLEHILLRPDTYIGSCEKQAQQLWVHDGSRMVQRTITYAPGLYKIFDEILVNAADNKVRDPSMDTLRVDINVVSTVYRFYLSLSMV
jgi:DNA topoisomerase-2